MNNQPVEHQLLHADGGLTVHSMFFTIQGEGPFAGEPAVFLRLTGCNLQCPLCDTEYSGGNFTAPHEILKLINHLGPGSKETGFRWPNGRLVVITGGEPFRQNIGPLVSILSDQGYRVQIETNGTLYVPGPWHDPNVTIVISPKTPKINERIAGYAKAFKYVACKSDISKADGLPIGVLGGWNGEHIVARPPASFYGKVYLQPADVKSVEMNRVNEEAVVQSCMKFGHTICLQLHKILRLE